MHSRYHVTLILTLTGLALSAFSAGAGNDSGDTSKTGHFVTDEIQVYNAEIAKVGQWTLQLHLNYALDGRKLPDFPGGLIPHHALNGTPELAYGITDWWELGFYAPFAVNQNGTAYSNAAKIRHLF